MSWWYKQLVRPALFELDSEEAHNLALNNLARICHAPVLCEAMAALFGAPALPVDCFGLSFPNPVGLAAGMDKRGVAVPAWAALGFGFSEVGGVTWHAQPGNPQPRMFRGIADEALVNRMGFNNGGAPALAEKLGEEKPTQIFFAAHTGKLYWKHFAGCKRVLIKDGFKRRRNADYEEHEKFSDLHLTYMDDGMDGFGDFLIVGDDYSESGGPAYAVAIHLTYIDPDSEDEMYVYHFVSDSNATPTDPAGKFAEALDKLIAKLDAGDSNLFEGDAVTDFRDLHEKGHFPGLGSIKKLSMKHHIETLADYLGK